jgi:electron transfer flavoprotein alpha subunit
MPSCFIFAISLATEPWSGAEATLLGAARRMADGLGGAAVLLRIGGGLPSANAARMGADRLLELQSASALPDHHVRLIAAAVAELKPKHVLFNDGSQDGDVARRLAVHLGARIAASVQRIQDGTVLSRSADGVDFLRPAPRILLLAQGAADPFEGAVAHEARPLVPPSPRNIEADRVRDLGPEPISVAELPLAEADFIVSAGDGVSDWSAFFEVVDALSATVGGSRQVCDAGLLPRSRQVGASGTLVQARCYLAFGISGAPQHLQGIQRCRFVAAVNTDLHAAMVKRADLAIIADAQAVMPALAALAREKTHVG